MSCETTNFRIEAKIVNATFPATVLCAIDQVCSDYAYTITSKSVQNIDYTVFAVSASQQVFSTTPPNAWISPPGLGDNMTGFLANSRHEYAVRFNPTLAKSGEAHILVVGASAPRISSVVLRSGGRQLESCLIAGPGIATKDPFQPVFQTQTVLVAGGKCVAKLTFDANGNIVDVTTDTPSCEVGSPDGGSLLINGEPLRNNTSPLGITFGTGTTTCYGPPVPSVPRCICTKRPCP